MARLQYSSFKEMQIFLLEGRVMIRCNGSNHNTPSPGKLREPLRTNSFQEQLLSVKEVFQAGLRGGIAWCHLTEQLVAF